MITVIDLPAELQAEVARHADNSTLLALRGAHRVLNINTFDVFKDRFLKRRRHITSRHSLQCLLEIARTPAFAAYVETLEFVAVEVDSGDFDGMTPEKEQEMVKEILEKLVESSAVKNVIVTNTFVTTKSEDTANIHGLRVLQREVGEHIPLLPGSIDVASIGVSQALSSTGYALENLALGFLDKSYKSAKVDWEIPEMLGIDRAWANTTLLAIGHAADWDRDTLAYLLSTAIQVRQLALSSTKSDLLSFFNYRLNHPELHAIVLQDSQMDHETMMDFIHHSRKTLKILIIKNVKMSFPPMWSLRVRDNMATFVKSLKNLQLKHFTVSKLKFLERGGPRASYWRRCTFEDESPGLTADGAEKIKEVWAKMEKAKWPGAEYV